MYIAISIFLSTTGENSINSYFGNSPKLPIYKNIVAFEASINTVCCDSMIFCANQIKKERIRQQKPDFHYFYGDTVLIRFY